MPYFFLIFFLQDNNLLSGKIKDLEELMQEGRLKELCVKWFQFCWGLSGKKTLSWEQFTKGTQADHRNSHNIVNFALCSGSSALLQTGLTSDGRVT